MIGRMSRLKRTSAGAAAASASRMTVARIPQAVYTMYNDMLVPERTNETTSPGRNRSALRRPDRVHECHTQSPVRGFSHRGSAAVDRIRHVFRRGPDGPLRPVASPRGISNTTGVEVS